MKLVQGLRGTEDDKLDSEAYEKTLQEVQTGAMMGPFTANVIHQMVLAGETLPEVDIDGSAVDIRDLLVGRTFTQGEGMVI